MRTRQDKIDQYKQRSLHFFEPEHPFRRACIMTVHNKWFDRLIAVTVFVCFLFLAFASARESRTMATEKNIFYWAELSFSTLFTIEFLLKIVAMGFINAGPRSYLRSGYNIIDFCVLWVGWMSLSPQIRWTAIRSLRLLRIIKIVNAIKGIRIQVTAIISSIPSLRSVFMFSMYIIVLFAVFFTRFAMGEMRYRCTDSSTATAPPEVVLSGPMCSTDPFWGRKCSVADYGPDAGCRDIGANPNWGVTSFDNVGVAALNMLICTSMEGWSEIMYLYGEVTTRWMYIPFLIFMLLAAYVALRFISAVLVLRYEQGKAAAESIEALFKWKKTRQQRITVNKVGGIDGQVADISAPQPSAAFSELDRTVSVAPVATSMGAVLAQVSPRALSANSACGGAGSSGNLLTHSSSVFASSGSGATATASASNGSAAGAAGKGHDVPLYLAAAAEVEAAAAAAAAAVAVTDNSTASAGVEMPVPADLPFEIPVSAPVTFAMALAWQQVGDKASSFVHSDLTGSAANANAASAEAATAGAGDAAGKTRSRSGTKTSVPRAPSAPSAAAAGGIIASKFNEEEEEEDAVRPMPSFGRTAAASTASVAPVTAPTQGAQSAQSEHAHDHMVLRLNTGLTINSNVDDSDDDDEHAHARHIVDSNGIAGTLTGDNDNGDDFGLASPNQFTAPPTQPMPLTPSVSLTVTNSRNAAAGPVIGGGGGPYKSPGVVPRSPRCSPLALAMPLPAITPTARLSIVGTGSLLAPHDPNASGHATAAAGDSATDPQQQQQAQTPLQQQMQRRRASFNRSSATGASLSRGWDVDTLDSGYGGPSADPLAAAGFTQPPMDAGLQPPQQYGRSPVVPGAAGNTLTVPGLLLTAAGAPGGSRGNSPGASPRGSVSRGMPFFSPGGRANPGSSSAATPVGVMGDDAVIAPRSASASVASPRKVPDLALPPPPVPAPPPPDDDDDDVHDGGSRGPLAPPHPPPRPDGSGANDGTPATAAADAEALAELTRQRGASRLRSDTVSLVSPSNANADIADNVDFNRQASGSVSRSGGVESGNSFRGQPRLRAATQALPPQQQQAPPSPVPSNSARLLGAGGAAGSSSSGTPMQRSRFYSQTH